MTNLKATDCTRPADNPFYLFHNTGEMLYPTSRSKIRRACCASTKSISISRGCLKLSFTASFVISLNTTLFSFESSSSNMFDKCQAIASPSRSGSLARKTFLAFSHISLIPLLPALYRVSLYISVQSYHQHPRPFGYVVSHVRVPLKR